MKPGTFGTIANRTETPPLPTPTSATDYKDAVIPFSAEFFSVPSKAASYITGNAFKERYKDTTVKPVFTRNLAARR